MADRSRSRSRSPGPPADQPPADAPPASDGAPPADDGAPAPAAAPEGGGDEVKLYVGNLDYATDETRLRDEFSQFGTVTEVFLPTERGTSRPRGFGFVTYVNRSSAEEAINKLDQTQLDGRTIRVNESRPRGEGGARGPPGGGTFNASGRDVVKLYVGNLSYDTTQETLERHFGTYGEVTDCFLPTDRDSGRPRGFAFVSMKAREAEEACDKCNGMELDGRTIRVNEAQPKESSRGGGGGGGYEDRGGSGGDRGGYGGGRGGGYEDRGGYGGGRGGYEDRGDRGR